MTRGWSVALGIGLVVLWLVGVSTPANTGWLTWFDGIAGVVGIIIGAAFRPGAERRAFGGGPIGLSVGLFALWIIGLATGAMAWQAWWTFAFACAYLLVGVGGAAGRGRMKRPSEEERPRRVA